MGAKRLPIDMEYVADVMLRLLRTPSPSGRTDQVMQLIGDELDAIGVDFVLTRRGALVGELPGERDGADRAVLVHADTIGAMVKRLKPNGRLEVVPIGTHSARFAEGARVTVFVDDIGHTYSGTILPLKASGHRYHHEVDSQGVGWSQVEVRVDEDVATHTDVAALGIQVGDFVAFDANPTITPSGYVKSRHLDDKAGVAAVLGAFKALVDHGVVLPVPAHLLITIAEEVGLGASHGLHADVAEVVSVDNAVVAPGQMSSERTANVAMQDASGPFDYHLTRRLIALCGQHDIACRRDVFSYYRSDVASALEAGAEMRAALMGMGVDASHGHERTHLDGIRSVAELVATWLQTELTFEHWDARPRGPLEDFPSTSVQPAEEQRPA